MPDSDLLAELARFIERIAAIARTGLAFKPDGFDSERYEELLKEAARMHSAVAGASDDDAEALRRKWREQVVAGYEGYVTAAVGMRRDRVQRSRRNSDDSAADRQMVVSDRVLRRGHIAGRERGQGSARGNRPNRASPSA